MRSPLELTLPLIRHAVLGSCGRGDSDGFGCNCGVDGSSSRRSCSSVGLYEPKIAVLAVRAGQSHGAMNAPAHIPFCALRAVTSSGAYALEERAKTKARPPRTRHALRAPPFVEEVASQRPKASWPLVMQEVSRDPMCLISRSRASIPQFQGAPCYLDRFDRSRERRRPGAEFSRCGSQWCRHLLSLQFQSMSVRTPK